MQKLTKAVVAMGVAKTLGSDETALLTLKNHAVMVVVYEKLVSSRKKGLVPILASPLEIVAPNPATRGQTLF